MHDITVIDSKSNGWTIRMVDRKEFAALKAKENFGQQALRAAKMKEKWATSEAFRGALSYTDGKIVCIAPRNEKKWLEDRGLTKVQM